MKIERKIILSNVFNIGLILLIGFFAMQNLNIILTKLRFVEIADDLNASFLEMRLSEKNYFLYHDKQALQDIREKIDSTADSLVQVGSDISKAIGEQNLALLKNHLRNYSEVLEDVRSHPDHDQELGQKFRTAGKQLREFSNSVTSMERKSVNIIIANSKNVLFYSFWAVLLLAIIVSHFLSQRILKSLRQIEQLARTISRGNFHKIEGIMPADEFGTVIGAINSMSEELGKREEELIQSKKLASLGILTAGVAHELTNPLNNISMIAQNFIELQDYLSKENRIELMKKVDGETKRIEDIVRNLLDFSKPKEGSYEKVDINSTIRKTIPLVQNMMDISNIELHLEFADDALPVYIDEHQIEQVLVNLIVNAVQAMSPGNQLTLATGKDADGKTVKIEVRDTGKGIPPEFLPHVFDPFFSTKGVGGTGLGLSVSYGIIKNHKGTIRVESTVGKGTTFTIELPAYQT